MSVRLRAATEADLAGWVAVMTQVAPYLVLSVEAEVHELRHEGPDVLRAVVEESGSVVGVARHKRLPDEDRDHAMMMVLPDARGRGVGRILWDWHRDLLAPGRAVRSIAEESGLAVAGHWGFVVDRSYRLSAVDPRTVGPVGAPPVGVEVVPLTEVDVRDVWEAHQRVARDDPSGLTLPVPFEEYDAEWRDPRMRLDLGRAALVDGRPVAFTLALAAGERLHSAMTGCLPEHRGRGLAGLVKRHALGAADDAGITVALTGNDEANAAMLAVNTALGYEHHTTSYGVVWG